MIARLDLHFHMAVNPPMSASMRVNSFVQPIHVWMPEMLLWWVKALTEIITTG